MRVSQGLVQGWSLTLCVGSLPKLLPLFCRAIRHFGAAPYFCQCPLYNDCRVWHKCPKLEPEQSIGRFPTSRLVGMN
jgi:hypothetical protein